MTTRIKNRENLLKIDKNILFLEKWEKQSKRFGKQRLFDLFQSAYQSFEGEPTREEFRWKFDAIILNTLQNTKNILWIKKKNYKELMSLFGKFKYSTEKYGDDLFHVLGGNGTSHVDIKPGEYKDGTPHIQQGISEGLGKKVGDTTNILDEIDLEELYAYDPNENWWNR